MDMNDILKLSAFELSEFLGERKLSSYEVTKAYADRIKKADGEIGAYITVTEKEALSEAEATDKKRADGEKLSALAGVPMALKDNVCTKGIKTTCASRMLADFVPPYDASVAAKLKKCGSVMLGKLNMDEFAMGATTQSSFFKKTLNPRDTSRVPGGSSGGPAAAVAANEAVYTLGTDTGGSIRQPASFCGVVGMRPTYGSVSRYGVVAFASSLDQVGPITKTVKDNALVFGAISGHDRKDAASVDRVYADYLSKIDDGVKGLKIGLPKEFFDKGISAEVKETVLAAAKKYEKMGADIIEVSLPTIKYALPAYYIISSAETSSNMARFDGVGYGYRSKAESQSIEELYKNSRSEAFGDEVKRRIMLGNFALSSGYYDAYYKKALQVRTVIMREFDAIYEKCDIVLAPVSPTAAYKIGEKTKNPLEMYMGDIYTVPVSIAGIPALSLPCGVTAEGLPVGMQLLGKAFDEATLYRAGHAYERETKITHSSFKTV